MNKILKNIATMGFVGYLPVAPGTWGSLVGAVFVAVSEPVIGCASRLDSDRICYRHNIIYRRREGYRTD